MTIIIVLIIHCDMRRVHCFLVEHPDGVHDKASGSKSYSFYIKVVRIAYELLFYCYFRAFFSFLSLTKHSPLHGTHKREIFPYDVALVARSLCYAGVVKKSAKFYGENGKTSAIF